MLDYDQRRLALGGLKVYIEASRKDGRTHGRATGLTGWTGWTDEWTDWRTDGIFSDGRTWRLHIGTLSYCNYARFTGRWLANRTLCRNPDGVRRICPGRAFRYFYRYVG